MQGILKDIETAVSEMDYLLQEGAVISAEERDQLTQLLNQGLSIAGDFNIRNGNEISFGINRTAAKILHGEFPEVSAAKLETIYSDYSKQK